MARHFDALRLRRLRCSSTRRATSCWCAGHTRAPAARARPHPGWAVRELSLQLSLIVAQETDADVTSLHLLPGEGPGQRDAPFRGIERVLRGLPEVTRREMTTDEPATTIVAEASGLTW